MRARNIGPTSTSIGDRNASVGIATVSAIGTAYARTSAPWTRISCARTDATTDESANATSPNGIASRPRNANRPAPSGFQWASMRYEATRLGTSDQALPTS